MTEIVEFLASGKSQAAAGRRWMWGGVLLAVALTGLWSGLVPAVMLGVVMSLAFGVVEWTQARHMRPGRRVALLDADGIESPLFNTGTKRFAWSEVLGVSIQTTQAVRQLQLELRPAPQRPDRRSFLKGINEARPQFPISALDAADQERLLELALERAGADAGTQVSEMAAERQFLQQLEALAPVPWVTYALIAANVLVWLAMLANGFDWQRAETPRLFAWGGNSAHEVQDGAWWRLLTATFLHSGLLHVAMNMLGLHAAGVTVERIFGHRLFALVYFGAALVGSAASLHFSAQKAVSVGASGAVFGVAGALLMAVAKHRSSLPRNFSKNTLGGIGVFVVYSLLQGFASPNIDNAAHVGGLLAGGVLAWLLPARFDPDYARRHVPARTLAALVLALAGTTLLAAMAPPARVNHRELFASAEWLQRGSARMQAAYKALADDQAAMKAGRMSEIEVDERTRTVHAPAFRRVLEDLDQVRLPAGEPGTAFVADLKRAVELTHELLAMDSDIVDGKVVPARPERAKQAEAELMQVQARLEQHNARVKAQKGQR